MRKARQWRRGGGPAAFVLGAGLLAGCAVPVSSGLDEAEANRVVLALDGADIDAQKELDPGTEGRFRVLVGRGDAREALTLLASEELPRVRPRGVLDAPGAAALVPSRTQEHAQLVAGLGGDLERTLLETDGVLRARVHLVVPEIEPLREAPAAPSSASVLLEHRGAAPPLTSDAIQRLVAGAVAGLEPARVTVVLVPRPARPEAARGRALARVGPLTVAAASSAPLKALLGALFVLLVAFAAATLGLALRAAGLRRRLEDAAPGPAPAPLAPSPPSAYPRSGQGSLPPPGSRA